ncbi:zwei Ig domain protein zig-8-like [Pollicipes pollicipes]|uniref:zwei Ig domain protein zig-8-like n=1 Tax=Pollicipes pollicipes TaxID=41117 RepID=UPI00188577D7|nr:zwei Ig domain protein zig-8-like [Pollicipes pollicipes]
MTSPEARTVTSRVNQPAHLHCRVANLGDRAVSWIRERDLHILTTGLFTYTRDKRFVAFHTGDTWTLKLLGPRVNDSGSYLCQVSTEPRISQHFSLTVRESRAYIASNRELYVKAGSSISLSCTLTHNISQLYWLHNGSVIHYTGWPQEDQPLGLGRIVASTAGRTSSVLVHRAGLTDSGLYTCQPTDAQADQVTVHVLTVSGRGMPETLPGHGGDEAPDGAQRQLRLEAASSLFVALWPGVRPETRDPTVRAGSRYDKPTHPTEVRLDAGAARRELL